MGVLFVEYLTVFLTFCHLISLSLLSVNLLPLLAGITYTPWTQTLPTLMRSFSARWVKTPVPLRTRCPLRTVSDNLTLINLALNAAVCSCVHVDVYMCLPAVPTHSLTGVPAVLAALTPLRRLSNQSASEPPASSTLISKTAGRSDGCVTEAEGTAQEVREGWGGGSGWKKMSSKRKGGKGEMRWGGGKSRLIQRARTSRRKWPDYSKKQHIFT